MAKLTAPAIGSNITPQMPREPPKEVLAQNFSLDPEIKIGEQGGQSISNDEGKKIETVIPDKEKEVKLPEPKVDVDVPVKEEVKEEVKKEEPKKEVKPILRPPADKKVDTKVTDAAKTKPSI